MREIKIKLFLRALYTVFAWFVLANEIPPGKGFFVSLFLFSSSLVLDYINFPKLESSKPDQYFKLIGICFSIIWLIMAVIGLFGILTVNEYNIFLASNECAKEAYIKISAGFAILKGKEIAAWIILSAIFVNVLVTIGDFIVFNAKKEPGISGQTSG